MVLGLFVCLFIFGYTPKLIVQGIQAILDAFVETLELPVDPCQPFFQFSLGNGPRYCWHEHIHVKKGKRA